MPQDVTPMLPQQFALIMSFW